MSGTVLTRCRVEKGGETRTSTGVSLRGNTGGDPFLFYDSKQVPTQTIDTTHARSIFSSCQYPEGESLTELCVVIPLQEGSPFQITGSVTPSRQLNKDTLCDVSMYRVLHLHIKVLSFHHFLTLVIRLDSDYLTCHVNVLLIMILYFSCNHI